MRRVQRRLMKVTELSSRDINESHKQVSAAQLRINESSIVMGKHVVIVIV